MPTFFILGQPFQTIRQCLEFNPELELHLFLEKLKEAVNWESFNTVIKTFDGKYYQIKFGSYVHYHPKFGFCETLNLESSPDFEWLEFRINSRYNSTVIFFHDHGELPDYSNSHLFYHKNQLLDVEIEKEVRIQTSLKRLPCSEKKYFTCQAIYFHLELNKRFGCQVSILRSGYHLENVIDEKLQTCTNMDILQVMIWFFVLLFINAIFKLKSVFKNTDTFKD